jgi:hypothetical protein
LRWGELDRERNGGGGEENVVGGIEGDVRCSMEKIR